MKVNNHLKQVIIHLYIVNSLNMFLMNSKNGVFRIKINNQ